MALEIHRVERLSEGGTVMTNGGIDFGHRGGGGSGSGSVSWSQISNKPNFASVAFSGSYNDLSNKPTIPAAYDDTALAARVTALENSGGSGGGTSYDDTAIKARMTAAENKLNNLATVATSGSYTDLTNKPTIPAAYDDSALVARVTTLEGKTDADTKPVLEAALTTTQVIGSIASGTTYPAGTSLETILRALLAPTVTPQLTYTITFNANGGTVTPTSGTTGTDGKLSSLPTPTHATDTFVGWFTASTGGNAVTTDTVFTSNNTIYAQWQAASAALPVFATVSSLTSLDEINIDYTQAEHIQNMPAQTETNPIIIEVPTEMNFVLTMWNPLVNQWVETPNKWDVSTTTRTIDGNDVAYTRYTENCECDSGAIRIRFTWS